MLAAASGSAAWGVKYGVRGRASLLLSFATVIQLLVKFYRVYLRTVIVVGPVSRNSQTSSRLNSFTRRFPHREQSKHSFRRRNNQPQQSQRSTNANHIQLLNASKRLNTSQPPSCRLARPRTARMARHTRVPMPPALPHLRPVCSLQKDV